MRILITNDDGIDAPGLKVLEEVAHSLTDDVWVVAPLRDQSGVGHGLTLGNPLRITPLSSRRFSVDGTPSDCVYLALNQLLKEHPPQFVLSGVNNSANLAEDISYSGTVAAAMEAALFEIPSIALSQVTGSGGIACWETVRSWAPEILSQLVHYPFQPRSYLNVNFPLCAAGAVAGVRVTRQGQRDWEDQLEHRVDPRGGSYYWVGAVPDHGRGDEGSDLAAVHDHFISVTPLTLDWTDYKVLEPLQRLFQQDFNHAKATVSR